MKRKILHIAATALVAISMTGCVVVDPNNAYAYSDGYGWQDGGQVAEAPADYVPASPYAPAETYAPAESYAPADAGYVSPAEYVAAALYSGYGYSGGYSSSYGPGYGYGYGSGYAPRRPPVRGPGNWGPQGGRMHPPGMPSPRGFSPMRPGGHMPIRAGRPGSFMPGMHRGPAGLLARGARSAHSAPARLLAGGARAGHGARAGSRLLSGLFGHGFPFRRH